MAQRAIAADHPARIVNILSMVVHGGQSFLAPYSASKAALANVTKNAAQALRSHHIRINGINCGWMDTPGEDAVQRKFHDADDDWLAKAEASQPFGMLVKPAHVAELASFMLSPSSGVMTGRWWTLTSTWPGPIRSDKSAVQGERDMTVNFGVLGAGRIGQVHARAIASVAGARLVAVADPVDQAAESVRDDYGCDVRTIDQIAGSDDVDAVVICTPTDTQPI